MNPFQYAFEKAFYGWMAFRMRNVPEPTMNFIDALTKIAQDEIGTEEVDGTNCGVRVNQYKAATNLPPREAWPWCAAFVCWCVRDALALAKIKTSKGFTRPTTAGALDLARWSLAQDQTTSTKHQPGRDIKPGDIILYKFATGGHCGIAVTSPDVEGFVQVVEGNTNQEGSREGGGVFLKRRNVILVHTRIRFNL